MVWNSPSDVISRGRARERQRGQQPRDQLVRVLPERDVTVGIVQEPPESRAHARGLFDRAFPFVVDELRRIEPGALLRFESDIGPGLMRVAGEEQALGDAKAGIVPRKIANRDGHGPYNCDRISHRSGKIGPPTVSRR